VAKVNLIVGGVQKGGTTTISQHLRNHPLVAFGDTKELHVASDKDRFADPDYDLNDAYPKRFANVVAMEGVLPRYLADATPVYCYWPNAIERLAAYNPATRLVLIYRDPIERAYSHWKMEYFHGRETLSFPEAIRSGRSRVASDPTAPGFHRVFSYVERGFYANQLRRVFAHFPREQVLVLETRALEQRVEETLTRIWNFLELDAPAAAPRPLRENTAFAHDYGYEFDQRDGEFLYRLFQYEIEAFADLSGVDVSHWGAAYRGMSAIASVDVLRERAPRPNLSFQPFDASHASASGALHEDTAFEGPPVKRDLQAEIDRLRAENEDLRAQLAGTAEKRRSWFGR
jgi:hypothetical protein